jgi:hypothetical protein
MEIASHHPYYLHLFSPNSKTHDLEERLVCAVEILTLLIMLLTIFVDVILFDLQHPPDDDGSCGLQTTETSCLFVCREGQYLIIQYHIAHDGLVMMPTQREYR